MFGISNKPPIFSVPTKTFAEPESETPGIFQAAPGFAERLPDPISQRTINSGEPLTKLSLSLPKKPAAWRLFDALVTDWGVSRKTTPRAFNPFRPKQTLWAEVDAQDVDIRFFLDSNNAMGFRQVQAAIPLCGNESNQGVRGSLGASDLLRNQETLKFIVAKKDVLVSPDTTKLLSHLFVNRRVPIANNETAFPLSFVGRLAKGAYWLNPEDMDHVPDLVRTLRNFGLESDVIGDWLLSLGNASPRVRIAELHGRIDDAGFQRRYRSVEQFFKDVKIGDKSRGHVALDLALNLPEPIEESLSRLRNLWRWGVASRSDFADEVAPRFLTPPNLGTLVDPQFSTFVKQLTSSYGFVVDNALALHEAVDLFVLVNEELRAKALMSSPRFAEALAFVRENHRGTLPLRSILKISEDFDRSAAETLLTNLGPQRLVNDAFLAAALSGNEQAQGLVSNRDKLIEQLKSQLERNPAVTRTKLSKISSDNYTERPHLEDLPTSFLLRALLLTQELQEVRDEASTALGKITRCDIVDRTTEYGGRIDIFSGGVLRIEQVPGYPVNDHIYYDPSNRSSQPGLGPFHLHAFDENLAEYAGPSIGGLSDISQLSRYSEPNVVITPVGHPPGENGQPDKKHLRLNVDLYMTVRSTTGEQSFEAVILDLGTHIVSYPHNEEHCSEMKYFR